LKSLRDTNKLSPHEKTKNLEDCLGKESWPFDRPIIVKNLCPLQVDVESATYVSPHDDICDVCIRRKGIRRKVLVPR